jgi:hypothetical protein
VIYSLKRAFQMGDWLPRDSICSSIEMTQQRIVAEAIAAMWKTALGILTPKIVIRELGTNMKLE